MSKLKTNTLETIDGTVSIDIKDMATAFITSGSNATGSWTRFPDGTQITYVYGWTSPSGSGASYDYPISFKQGSHPTPQVSHYGNTIVPTYYGQPEISPTSSNHSVLRILKTKFDGTPNIDAVRFNITAIGRWK